jgi:hypothetical protein
MGSNHPPAKPVPVGGPSSGPITSGRFGDRIGFSGDCLCHTEMSFQSQWNG